MQILVEEILEFQILRAQPVRGAGYLIKIM